MRLSPHDQLAHNLALFLERSNRMCFEKVNLGSAWMAFNYKDTYRNHTRGVVDVISFKTSFTNTDITIYEVKRDRSDLLCDIRKEKWRKYIPFCNRVVFAYPHGVATENDIPKECGIMEYNSDKKTWRTVRRGDNHKPERFDFDTMMALIMSAHNRMNQRELQRIAMERVTERKHVPYFEIKQHFGIRVADGLRMVEEKDVRVRKHISASV